MEMIVAFLIVGFISWLKLIVRWRHERRLPRARVLSLPPARPHATELEDLVSFVGTPRERIRLIEAKIAILEQSLCREPLPITLETQALISKLLSQLYRELGEWYFAQRLPEVAAMAPIAAPCECEHRRRPRPAPTAIPGPGRRMRG